MIVPSTEPRTGRAKITAALTLTALLGALALVASQREPASKLCLSCRARDFFKSAERDVMVCPAAFTAEACLPRWWTTAGRHPSAAGRLACSDRALTAGGRPSPAGGSDALLALDRASRRVQAQDWLHGVLPPGAAARIDPGLARALTRNTCIHGHRCTPVNTAEGYYRTSVFSFRSHSHWDYTRGAGHYGTTEACQYSVVGRVERT